MRTDIIKTHFLYTYYNEYFTNEENIKGIHFMRSSPNADLDEGYYSVEALQTYAEFLNAKFDKIGIKTNFEVKFCSMDGYHVVTPFDIHDVNPVVLKLKGYSFAELDEEINDFLNEHWDYTDEEKQMIEEEQKMIEEMNQEA